MCAVEIERDPSGCRASGLTPELPVHFVLVPPWLVPSMLVPPLLVPLLLRLQALVGPTDGATSSRLQSGLPSEFGYTKDPDFIVPATALSSRRFFSRCFAAPEAYRRCRLSNGYITEDGQVTFSLLQQTQLTTLHQSIQSTVFLHYNGVLQKIKGRHYLYFCFSIARVLEHSLWYADTLVAQLVYGCASSTSQG